MSMSWDEKLYNILPKQRRKGMFVQSFLNTFVISFNFSRVKSVQTVKTAKIEIGKNLYFYSLTGGQSCAEISE